MGRKLGNWLTLHRKRVPKFDLLHIMLTVFHSDLRMRIPLVKHAVNSINLRTQSMRIYSFLSVFHGLIHGSREKAIFGGGLYTHDHLCQ